MEHDYTDRKDPSPYLAAEMMEDPRYEYKAREANKA